jgi:translocation and assembly module TamB
MKRWLITGALLTALLFALFTWGIYFLFWTPAGVHWLLGKVRHYAGVEIQAAKVSGRLAGELTVEGLQVRWGGGRLDMERLRTSLDPRHLLGGKIHWKAVVAQGINWEEQEDPPTPLDLTLPRIPAWLGRINLEVETLRLEGIRYRYNQDPPWSIPEITGRLAWREGTLAVNPLEAKLVSGRLQGTLGLGLAGPFLELSAHFFPKAPAAGVDFFHLQARLKKGRAPAQLSGPLTLTGRTGGRERLALLSEVEVGPHRITLSRVSIRDSSRQGTIAGRGEILFQADGTHWVSDWQMTEVDFSPELKLPVRLTGDFHFAGTPAGYGGRFDMKNNPNSWQDFRMAGTYQGKDAGLEIELERGDWLKGVFGGRLVLAWDGDFSLQGSLSGREVRPEAFDPRWPGLINLDLKGDLRWPKAGRSSGTLDLRLLESHFQEKRLQGGLTAAWENDRLEVKKAALQGRGFTLTAAGVLDERLQMEARIADLSPLLADGRGSGSARGWVRWRGKKWGGQVFGQLRNFSWQEVQAGDLDLEALVDQEEKDTGVALKARIQKGSFKGIPVDFLALRIGGTLARQDIHLSGEGPQGRIQAALNGGYARQAWQGTLVSLAGAFPRDQAFRLLAPAELVVGGERVRLSPLALAGPGEERLTLEVDLTRQPLAGFLRVAGQRLRAERVRPWLESWRPEGRLGGQFLARFSAGDLLAVQGRAELSGSVQAGGRRVEVRQAEGQVTWDESGLRAGWEAKLAGGETWSVRAVSTEKARLAIPPQGTFRSSLQDFRLENLEGAFPAGLTVRGKAGGRFEGRWREGLRWDLTGDLQIKEGTLSWKSDGADLQARLSRAEIGLRWQEEALRGNLSLELEKVGKASGEFSLPLAARWPLKMQPSGAVHASLAGKMRENGLVAGLLPQAVRASRGNLEWDLAVRGAWGKPLFSGTFALAEAGADLPLLGIRLQEVSARGGFREDRVHIESLVLKSGPGTLNGGGTLRLQGWRIASLEGRLTGKDFQFINRPDLQGLASPDLEFNGTPENIRVGGKIEIPEALISAGPAQGVKKASPDVVIVDAPRTRAAARPFPIQGQIDLLFGEKVRIKVGGLNTLLKGKVRLDLVNSQELKAEGEIRADQGHYLVQGSKLDITRGRLIFRGPPDNPTLDLLALRTIRGSQRLEDRVDEVRAGVVVTGTVRSPLVRLYSQPAMSDSDILSYILFGNPLGRGTDRTDLALLGKAARSLLGERTESTLLSKLDLDSLDIQTGGGDLSRSMVMVGKYLNPRLFLGLGGSLFSNTFQVILRYALTPRLELETRGGTQSGGGIFFRADFE